jgi:UDP-N-acetylmuramate--alanine ligase
MSSIGLKDGVLHFVGIGGIGMSGIAEVLNVLGYGVQGSDLSNSANVQRLAKQGIRTLIGHDGENIKAENGDFPAAVVVSSAIKQDNPELVAARAAKVPVVRRAEMLAELMRLKTAIAIGGTHGKTTTTSMVGQMMEVANFDPTVINGGIVNAYGTNTRLGESEWMVVEADESDGTFTRLPATIAVVTNMDPEHMDHYGDFEAVKAAYRQFVLNLPYYGFAVLCLDHPEVQALIPSIQDRKIITYGFSPQADVQAINIRPHVSGSVFDVRFAGWLSDDGQEAMLKDVNLNMPGQHNVQNSLVALSIAKERGVADALMKKALDEYQGVKRRFTKTGESLGVTIIDDYAHHPVEIETVLKAARSVADTTGGKLIAVMQPHRYTRLDELFDEFAASFNNADHVLIADVYEAGETPIEGADKDSLVHAIAERGHNDVQALSSPDALAGMVSDLAQEGDLVICLGAGDITAWAYDLPKQLDALSKTQSNNAA